MDPQSKTEESFKPSSSLEIRRPTVGDAASIWQIVRDCEVLDTNSCYAYLLICRDFSATSLVAAAHDGLVGFVSAYIPPSRPDVVFVWQIGTARAARGRGVGKSLLRNLMKCPACRNVQYLEATVTPTNTASRRLFRSIAEEFKSEFDLRDGFGSEDFGPPQNGSSQHEPEELIRIGPIEVRDENV